MRVTVLVGLALLVAACASVSPAAIKAGDVCYNCGQAITDPRLAAEAIGNDGTVMKFKGVTCLADHLSKHPAPLAGVWVTDYATGRFLRPETAMYVRAPMDPNTRRLEYFAFQDVSRAVAFGDEHQIKPVDWPRVMQAVAGN